MSESDTNPTFTTDLTSKQRESIGGDVPRGAKIEPGAHASDAYIEEHVERESSSGLLDPTGPSGHENDPPRTDAAKAQD